MLQVRFQGRHFEASVQLQSSIEEAIRHRARFNDRVTSAQVTLDRLPTGQRTASVQVHVSGHGVLAASAEGESMHEAVEGMLDRLERLLKKENEKSKDHRAPSMNQVVAD